MRIPVVLATVHVDIDTDGRMLVNTDGEPYAADRELTRSQLRSVLDDITTGLGTAVRVEVHEGDGATYSDIITPPTTTDRDEEPSAARAAPAAARPGLTGSGFRPGEQVAVAYVLCTQTAGADGAATVHLPPTLLIRPGHRMVLVGTASGNVAEIATSP